MEKVFFDEVLDYPLLEVVAFLAHHPSICRSLSVDYPSIDLGPCYVRMALCHDRARLTLREVEGNHRFSSLYFPSNRRSSVVNVLAFFASAEESVEYLCNLLLKLSVEDLVDCLLLSNLVPKVFPPYLDSYSSPFPFPNYASTRLPSVDAFPALRPSLSPVVVPCNQQWIVFVSLFHLIHIEVDANRPLKEELGKVTRSMCR